MEAIGTRVLVHLVVVAKEVLATLDIILVIHQIRGIIEQGAFVLITITMRVLWLHALLLVCVVMQSGGTITDHGGSGETLNILIT